jgi:hypothetical protein
LATVQVSDTSLSSESPSEERRRWWHLSLLSAFLLLSFAIYIVLFKVAPQPEGATLPFTSVWVVCFVLYLGACLFVLKTKPLVGRWLWLEIGLVFTGALIFRVMLLPLPTGLSRDAWRYLWDAHVIVHGYSPYVYAPGDKILIPLRNFLFANSRFRNITTDYPPGAELIFVVSYLLSPGNIFVLKGIFVGFDLVTCGTLALFLLRKGLDVRRVIIYAWCPLPIVEFAIEGHVDAATVIFMVLAIVSATSSRRGMRALTGFLIGMATLTRLYPILLLVVVVRRSELTLRKLALLLTCFATIFLGYLPFIILGHGQVFGFFLTYINQQGGNSGSLQLLTRSIGTLFGLNLNSIVTLEHIVDVVVVGTVSLTVLILRWRERISMEAATLVMIGLAFAISSHIFPWYTTVILPWVAILVGPLWKCKRLSGKGLAVAIAWYFTTIVVLSYIAGVPASYIRPTWFLDNVLLFIVGTVGIGVLTDWVVIAGLVVAAITGMVNTVKSRRVQSGTGG